MVGGLLCEAIADHLLYNYIYIGRLSHAWKFPACSQWAEIIGDGGVYVQSGSIMVTWQTGQQASNSNIITAIKLTMVLVKLAEQDRGSLCSHCAITLI